MTVTVPGILRRDARPPIEMDAAPAPGAVTAVRPTVIPRPWVTVSALPAADDWHQASDPAVRRYWTALIGPGAVADLLRLVAAASSGTRIRRPLHLPLLATEGLVEVCGPHVRVPTLIPRLEGRRLARLSPALRVEYRRVCQDS